jgi:hypothetical protein
MWWKRVGGRELRELLMRSWDPIGVSGWPDAADEYDSYMGDVATMLREERSIEDLASYLAWAREQRMGLREYRERDLAVAQEVSTWYRESIARYGESN